jgi:hypothetical protein
MHSFVHSQARKTKRVTTFFFNFKDLSTGTFYDVQQMIKPTLSAGVGGTIPDAFFIKQYVKKLKAAQSLAWVELSIDAENIIHSRVRILVTADLPKVFFGSMLRNVLFSCGLDFNQRQDVWCTEKWRHNALCQRGG